MRLRARFFMEAALRQRHSVERYVLSARELEGAGEASRDQPEDGREAEEAQFALAPILRDRTHGQGELARFHLLAGLAISETGRTQLMDRARLLGFVVDVMGRLSQQIPSPTDFEPAEGRRTRDGRVQFFRASIIAQKPSINRRRRSASCGKSAISKAA